MFFTKLLNLLPPSIVRFIGNSSFANLAERQRIETWIVIEKPEELDLQPDCYYYCGLQLKIVHSSESWNWFVYGGRGIDLIDCGTEPTEEKAIASAKKLIDEFFCSEDVG